MARAYRVHTSYETHVSKCLVLHMDRRKLDNAPIGQVVCQVLACLADYHGCVNPIRPDPSQVMGRTRHSNALKHLHMNSIPLRRFPNRLGIDCFR